MSEVKPIPERYSTVTPSLTCDGCAEAIVFYREAFGAEEVDRAAGPDGTVWHAEIRIGDAIVMLNDEFPQHGSTAPTTLGGSPVSLFVYVEDVDAAYERAVDAGAESTMEPTDMFWGDRTCGLVDPFGHRWSIATRVEELSPEELARRQEEARAEWSEG